MKNLIIVACLLAITSSYAVCQTTQPSVINSSGGSYVSGNYLYEWSIGELVLVNEMAAADGKYILTNGFLQPFVRNADVVIPPVAFGRREIHILTNPVRDVLGIQFLSNERGTLRLIIYDETGHIRCYRALNVNAAVTTETINMMNCANGNYVLTANFENADKSKNKKAQSYKIIKIH